MRSLRATKLVYSSSLVSRAMRSSHPCSVGSLKPRRQRKPVGTFIIIMCKFKSSKLIIGKFHKILFFFEFDIENAYLKRRLRKDALLEGSLINENIDNDFPFKSMSLSNIKTSIYLPHSLPNNSHFIYQRRPSNNYTSYSLDRMNHSFVELNPPVNNDFKSL